MWLGSWGQRGNNNIKTVKSECELFTGDISTRQSFTRIQRLANYTWDFYARGKNESPDQSLFCFHGKQVLLSHELI